MPENVNTSVLEIESELADDSSKKTMIKVDHVSMIFNMASEQLNSIKEYAIAALKRELRFKEFRALDDVSFEVKQGDVFGILGTNGSGKSTILKIIAGVLEPSKGSCTVNGNIAPLIELGAGFDMELTARENIYLNGALLGYSKQFIEENFDDIVEFAEVEKFLDMPMKNYSSGMVARIAFAIATVIVPEILIVDEVLSVGDFMFQKKCEDRITKLIKEHGVTVLIVSHNNDQIERLCNKAVWIEKGHLRMAGTAEEVCGAYRILGGHPGSEESERVVFGLLEKGESEEIELPKKITAETKYGLAAKLTASCYPAGASTVVVTSDLNPADPLLANSLAGALDSPLLLMRGEGLPDATAQELNRLNPKKIVFVLSGDSNERTVADMRTQFETSCELEFLLARNSAALAMEILKYGGEKELWGDAAVYVWRDSLADLTAIAPISYSRCWPIVLSDSDGLPPDSFVASVKREGGISKCVFVGEQAPELEEEKMLCYSERLIGTGPCNTNEIIARWQESQLPKVTSLGAGSYCVVAFEDLGFVSALGPYAAKNNLVVLLTNPNNLDSMAYTIDFLGRQGSKCSSLLFVGSSLSFNSHEMRFFAKALCR